MSEAVGHNVTIDSMNGQHLWARLGDLDKDFAWYTGVTLMGLTLKYDPEGVLVVVKGERHGKSLVAFTGGRSWFDALEVLLWEMAHGQLTWHKDKYAK